MPPTEPVTPGGRSGRRSPAGQAAGPTVAVVGVALLLQLVVLTIAPRASGARLLGAGSGSALDFAMSRNLAIPGLAPTFVTSLAGQVFQSAPQPDKQQPGPQQPVQHVSTSPSPTPARFTPTPSLRPSSSPTHSPSPTPRSSGLFSGGAANVITFMTVDRTQASTNDFVTYKVIARNLGGTAVIDEFSINTHTPQGTQRCGVITATGCVPVAGDYDGTTTSPGDVHQNPPTTTQTMNVPAHSDVALLTLTVQVLAATAPGTVLHNHAHVIVAGVAQDLDHAPDVTIS